jgi:hypothetical protein
MKCLAGKAMPITRHTDVEVATWQLSVGSAGHPAGDLSDEPCYLLEILPLQKC